jgi:hypothetical protein
MLAGPIRCMGEAAGAWGDATSDGVVQGCMAIHGATHVKH